MKRNINELLNDPDWDGKVSGVILAAKGNDIVAHKAFGVADRSWNNPNQTDTVFPVASITKFFTAALVAKLAEDKLIDLNQTLLHYLPAYRPDTGSRITIHHLLSHTSGLGHYPKAIPGFMKNEARRAHDNADFAKQYCSGDLLSEPGELFLYSNDNYHLLGLVVENVWGDSYENALKKYIFEPAGMSSSGLANHETIVPRMAKGYDWKTDHYENAPFVELSVPWAAGGIYSTAEDMFKFYRGLESGKILSAESFKMICSPQIHGSKGTFGYGCLIGNRLGDDIVTIPGSLPGFDNSVWFQRSSESFMVMLTNVWGQRPLELTRNVLAKLIRG